MATRRNGIGQIKRDKPNRDYRRAHIEGAMKFIRWRERPVESFKGRMLATLNRLIGKGKEFP